MLPQRGRAPRAGRLLRRRGARPRAAAAAAGERFQPFAVEPGHLGFDEYDVVRQGLVSHHSWIEGEHVDVISPPFRYVWPSELDLMAQLAGMALRGRRGDWNREPFTAASVKHVSVWAKTR
jgi:hypothetical protein